MGMGGMWAMFMDLNSRFISERGGVGCLWSPLLWGLFQLCQDDVCLFDLIAG